MLPKDARILLILVQKVLEHLMLPLLNLLELGAHVLTQLGGLVVGTVIWLILINLPNGN